MANLLDWNTLEHKVKAYLDTENGIDTNQKAFPILMVSVLLGLSDEESEDAVTDGPKDRGVDAVFVDDRDGSNSIHLFQFKYVDTFENTKKNFPSSEIDKLLSFVSDLLDMNKSMEQTCNPILWSKVKEIWQAIDKPNPKIEVHFCGNLEQMTVEETTRAENSFDKYKYFHVHHHSLDSIVTHFIDGQTEQIDDALQVVDKDYFDRTDGSIRGMICTVDASEIVRIISDPENPNKIRKDIFNDNVRIYMSRTNKINRKIIETATSENKSLFWYLNNGITITCDSFSYLKSKRAPIVDLKNIQIVNGGQTSNALFEAYHADENQLEDVLILVRVIETKSQSVSLSIAESTNSQTPIKSRDLRSNDDVQKKLEEAFKSMGLFYERKLKQYASEQRMFRIDALSAGQSYLAFGMDLPEIAKKDRGRIFSDLYDQVFTDELTADQLHCSFKLLNVVEREKKQLQTTIKNDQTIDNRKLFLIDGAYHVLFAMAQICDFKRIDRFEFSQVVEYYEDAREFVANVVEQEQDKDESFSFNRFFKDSKTKTKISTYIQRKLSEQ